MTITFLRDTYRLSSNCPTPDLDPIKKTIVENLGGWASGFYCGVEQVEKRKQQTGENRQIFLQQPNRGSFSWLAFYTIDEFKAFCKAYDCMTDPSPIVPDKEFRLLLPRVETYIYPVRVELGEDWESYEKLNITHFRHKPSNRMFICTLEDLLDMIRAVGGTPGNRQQWQIERISQFYEHVQEIKQFLGSHTDLAPTLEENGYLWYSFTAPSPNFSIEGRFTEQHPNGFKRVSYFKSHGRQLLVR